MALNLPPLLLVQSVCWGTADMALTWWRWWAIIGAEQVERRKDRSRLVYLRIHCHSAELTSIWTPVNLCVVILSTNSRQFPPCITSGFDSMLWSSFLSQCCSFWQRYALSGTWSIDRRLIFAYSHGPSYSTFLHRGEPQVKVLKLNNLKSL